jgi:hypothetical protein
MKTALNIILTLQICKQQKLKLQKYIAVALRSSVNADFMYTHTSNDTYLIFIHERMTFDEAVETCKEQNATLAYIERKELSVKRSVKVLC